MKSLPHIAISIQQKMRNNKNLKLLFKNILKKITYIFDEKEKIIFIQEKIDSLNQKYPKNLVSCKSGCANCCYHEILASKEELKIIKSKLNPEQIKKFTYQSGFLNQSDIEYSQRACPILNSKKECSLYKHRPLICRATIVSSSPESCIIENNSPVMHCSSDEAALYILAYYGQRDVLPMRFINSL